MDRRVYMSDGFNYRAEYNHCLQSGSWMFGVICIWIIQTWWTIWISPNTTYRWWIVLGLQDWESNSWVPALVDGLYEENDWYFAGCHCYRIFPRFWEIESSDLVLSAFLADSNRVSDWKITGYHPFWVVQGALNCCAWAFFVLAILRLRSFLQRLAYLSACLSTAQPKSATPLLPMRG